MTRVVSRVALRDSGLERRRHSYTTMFTFSSLKIKPFEIIDGKFTFLPSVFCTDFVCSRRQIVNKQHPEFLVILCIYIWRFIHTAIIFYATVVASSACSSDRFCS